MSTSGRSHPLPRLGQRRTRSAPVALTALAATALLAGCGVLGGSGQADPPTEEGVLHEQGTTEVELAVGETVQVSLGEGSQGVGDDWGVISQTDESVAEAEVVMDENVVGAEEGQDAPGVSMPYAVELTGLDSGTTTVRVLYCTRAEIAEDCDQSKGTLDPPVDPVEITVTVR